MIYPEDRDIESLLNLSAYSILIRLAIYEKQGYWSSIYLPKRVNCNKQLNDTLCPEVEKDTSLTFVCRFIHFACSEISKSIFQYP